MRMILSIIAFFRFIFRGKLPAPQPTIVSDPEYKIGGVFPDGKVIVRSDNGSVMPIMGEIKETQPDLAHRIIAYMEAKNYIVDRSAGGGNIVYTSGMRDVFGFANENKMDEWDDMRLIIKFNEGGSPYIDFWQAASTEPGTISRKSAAAKRLGGVATVVPGQYRAWKFGYHKHNFDHPALVQCANIIIWRDGNMNEAFDGGEMMFEGIYGINQHSTKPGFDGPRVGQWSAGCLVAKDFAQHLQFLDRLRQWDCYKNDSDCLFWTTIISAKTLFNDTDNT